MQYYTIKELSEKLDVKPHRVRHLVLKEKIRSIKQGGVNSAYKIPHSELETARELFGQSAQKKSNVKAKKRKSETLPEQNEQVVYDFLDMQKTLADTMRDLASTQEKIAETLKLLAERM